LYDHAVVILKDYLIIKKRLNTIRTTPDISQSYYWHSPNEKNVQVRLRRLPTADCPQQTASRLALAKRHKPASVYTVYIYLVRQFVKRSLRCARPLQDQEQMFGYKTVN